MRVSAFGQRENIDEAIRRFQKAYSKQAVPA